MVFSSRVSLLVAILASASTAAAFSMQMNYKHRYGKTNQLTWPTSFAIPGKQTGGGGKGFVPESDDSPADNVNHPTPKTSSMSASSLSSDLLNVVGDPYPPQPAITCLAPQTAYSVSPNSSIGIFSGDPTKNIPMQVTSLWGINKSGPANRLGIEPVVDPSAPAPQYQALVDPEPEPEPVPMPDPVLDVLEEAVEA